jgi:hypothetical protein
MLALDHRGPESLLRETVRKRWAGLARTNDNRVEFPGHGPVPAIYVSSGPLRCQAAQGQAVHRTFVCEADKHAVASSRLVLPAPACDDWRAKTSASSGLNAPLKASP